jgi:hypothetical protein
MQVREAAATLDVEETQVKNLIREGRLTGLYRTPQGVYRHFPKGKGIGLMPVEAGRTKPGDWWVDGASVRTRRKLMNQPVSHRNGIQVGKGRR